MVSGGDRKDAPQSNFGISATGGAGSKDGQPKRYIPGMKSLGSTGVETMAQQGQAPLEQVQTPAAPSTASLLNLSAGKLRTLLDDTNNPMEPQSTGVDFGRGAGSSVLPASLRNPNQRLLENKAIVNKYWGSLVAASRQPDAPDSYKQFLSYLMNEMR